MSDPCILISSAKAVNDLAGGGARPPSSDSSCTAYFVAILVVLLSPIAVCCIPQTDNPVKSRRRQAAAVRTEAVRAGMPSLGLRREDTTTAAHLNHLHCAVKAGRGQRVPSGLKARLAIELSHGAHWTHGRTHK